MDLSDMEFRDVDSRQPRFKSSELRSSTTLQGAVYALRMIDGHRWLRRLIDRDGDCDSDVLKVIGLEVNDHGLRKITVTDLREATTAQRGRLERRMPHCPDLLTGNIDKLGDMLKLNATERAVLRLAVVTTCVEGFGELFQKILATSSDLMRVVHQATGRKVSDVTDALDAGRTLRRSGFFERERMSFQGRNPLELDDSVIDALLAHRFDEACFLRRLVRPAPPSSLTLADFAHLPDLDLMQRYLKDVAARRRKGCNILLYGAPGTGKTEFARALAPALQMDLHEVPNEDAGGDPISGRERFGAYTVCQNILGSRRRQLLLFDEVEDVFGLCDGAQGSLFALFGAARIDPDELRKSWVNETLESNPVPAIWVCNSIGAIDAAFLRRFDLIVEFRAPSRAVRRRMIDRHFRGGEISLACAERLANIEHLPPAQVERAARVVRTLHSRNVSTRDAEAERVLAASLRAMGHRSPASVPALPAHYDPAFLNTDRDLVALAEGFRRGSHARLCLYGPSGTGKTAFAHHLGRSLDRVVLVKRGSDLLSKYLGGTEKLIAQAFEEARDNEAILLIDEADSFLQDRTGAQRSWEVTQVNELLTQMEAFEGLFVASTNLIDTLDAASLRRFDFKVKFDYLTRAQRRAMLSRIATDAQGESAETRTAFAQIDRLEYLTPGDFANALRQVHVTGDVPTPAQIVLTLAAEQAMKPEGKRRTIGFGPHG